MKTIVSLTPLRVQEDSRTFKIAASVARWGYNSVAVEGEASELNRAELPFKIISIGVITKSKSELSGLNQDHIREQAKLILMNIGKLLRRIARGIAGLPFELLRVCDTNNEVRSSKHIGPKRSVWDKVVVLFIFKFIKPIYELLPKPLRYLYQVSLGFVCFLTYLVYFVGVSFFRPLCHIPRASLYYLHAPYYFPAVYFLCKRYKVPFIYDAHDFYIAAGEKENPTLLEKRWIYPFLSRLERCCVNRAAAVVTVCDGIAQLQEKVFGCHPVVARNCHDGRLDRVPQAHLRQLLGLSADDFLIIAIGRPKEGRPVIGALDAMRELPDSVHLAFLGKDTDQYIGLIGERKIEKRVHVIPPVKPFEVVPFIQDADASLILYYSKTVDYENALPNTFFQSIAAELPLLYPELPEINKIVKQYGLGIPINPLDPKSIASGVLQLMTDPERFSMYRRNLRIAKEELSWEREEVILRELLSRVLDKQGCEE